MIERLPYLLNILILVPCCIAMSSGAGAGMTSIFEGRVAPSEGLRIMVFGMWTAILLGSVAGLWLPRQMLPLLAMQVIYKAIWLALFILPLWRSAGAGAVPWGITLTFAGIVLVWPWFIARAWNG